MKSKLSTQISSVPTVQVRQASVSAPIGVNWILQDLSFEIPPNQFVAVVGPSGAGKTSLLRLLNRLSDPTQGSVFLDGTNLRQLPVIVLRQQVVLAPQEPKLLGMSVEEALLYPLELQGLPPEQRRQRLMEGLEQSRIPSEWLNRTEVQLSLGQRQRVAIARALIMQPKILLLDEPTSSLDLGQAHHLLRTIASLVQSERMTVLMANHQLHLTQQYCTYVLHLQAGRLVQAAPADQIDWTALKDAIVQAQVQDEEDWGDEFGSEKPSEFNGENPESNMRGT